MNPHVPNPYKNFLPSKKFVRAIGALALIAFLIFLIPKVISWINAYRAKSSLQTAIIAAVPSGDPTTRDSDGDGIPDWEEIAVGLNPFNPETIPGVPDAVTFAKIKAAVGADNFQTAADNATDSDKVGLAMYNDMSQDSIASGSTSTDAVSAVTGTEVANYIVAQQAKNKTYAMSDLTVSDDTAASVNAYYTAMSKLDSSPFDADFDTHLTNYIQGTESKDTYLTAKVAIIANMVSTLLSIPVPPTAAAMHLAAINDLYGVEQTIDNYDPSTTDNLSQLGTVGLAESYIRNAITDAANITEYFSVAVEPNSASK